MSIHIIMERDGVKSGRGMGQLGIGIFSVKTGPRMLRAEEPITHTTEIILISRSSSPEVSSDPFQGGD